MKRLLVACEESQRVCTAFREIGWEAYSCDIIECSGGHPEWHIQQDVLPLLNGNCTFRTMDGAEHTVDGKWDMIIAHPPCTYTSNAGAKHLFRGGRLNLERYYKGLCGKAFFMTFMKADCDRIVVENPTPSSIFDFPKHSQVIQPYYFGEHCSKRTLLWEKGVKPLNPTNIVEPLNNCHTSGTWFMQGGKDRQRNRAKTFIGVAKAMAEQWGKDATE